MQAKSPNSRFALIGYMLLIAIAYFSVTRGLLTAVANSQADLSIISIPKIYFVGLIYDLAFYSYALIPVTLYLLFVPERLWQTTFHRGLVHLAIFSTLYTLGFILAAELLFWDEFSVRFNFISVDYLVYRREVTDNIRESYPLPLYLSAIFLVTLVVYGLSFKRIARILSARQLFRQRLVYGMGLLALPVLSFFLINQDYREVSNNSYQNELASNGPYQFISAFKNNELDYYKFYQTLPDSKAATLLQKEIGDGSQVNASFDIKRQVDNPGSERHLNIFLIMVESLSANYLETFGNSEQLTPNLDRLANESMLFTNLYATGTRTTRGLEAVTLSIPPTPGRSIVKRIGHETNLWSLGNVLKKKDYDVEFIYGGRGYFENMNAFFAGNGYGIIDQSSTPDSEMGFSNAWGMADDDLYNQAIKAADSAHSADKPFFFHLMTTTNHRPYTYPDGRIDIPSGSGRSGAVKYTDWAIGDMIEKARTKPWFKDTLFVIIADHTSGSAGKSALPVQQYHIPMLVYSPAHIKPQRVDNLSSQIDVAPTLLALMNMDYESAFFGKNILTMKLAEQRALIGNYQKLGLFADNKLSILSPKRGMDKQLNAASETPQETHLDLVDADLERDIAYYQGASYIFSQHLNAWEQKPVTR
ncbi:LTA synthase family protein [Sedimenticola selenatireducens]|uniref:Sulfatase-like hydrolase/transferase n=1 Tax=Sedimenticola selenatireducens TaxID=191960 RepID=A0A558DRR4_9GAMM|nr:LTA synthase family protein [Sedimenticola selenatireducens]TVO75835.1 sulfatase-like hydrolase/transferase [Sedimenticola selenatireducens]TVT63694.1 MAG: sulfatase-like hydrolase/transferase [Sedimenticola selenatireducens]